MAIRACAAYMCRVERENLVFSVRMHVHECFLFVLSRVCVCFFCVCVCVYFLSPFSLSERPRVQLGCTVRSPSRTGSSKLASCGFGQKRILLLSDLE